MCVCVLVLIVPQNAGMPHKLHLRDNDVHISNNTPPQGVYNIHTVHKYSICNCVYVLYSI